MTQIMIEVDDDIHTAMLLELLSELQFVRTAKEIPIIQKYLPENNESDNFFSLAGIWAGRDVTQDSIREQAWLKPHLPEE